MIYSELQTAILSDTHREDYSTHIVRFIQQAEALIAINLEGYFLEAVIGESARITNPTTYNLPAKVVVMKSVHQLGEVPEQLAMPPLTQVDETLVQQYQKSHCVQVFCMRDTKIVFGGTPPTDAQFHLHYFGLPAALAAPSDTNNLLNDCPQLYIEAAQVYLFKRARNFEASSVMFQSVQSLIKELNRKMKKKLGGGQSANAYNVSFRSSY